MSCCQTETCITIYILDGVFYKEDINTTMDYKDESIYSFHSCLKHYLLILTGIIINNQLIHTQIKNCKS